MEAGELACTIIMTSLAFIFGVLPLAVAMGAGANARHSIGTGIIGGMIGETTLAMLYVPLFFYLFDQLTEKLAERKKAKAKPNEGGEQRDRPQPGPNMQDGRGSDMKRLISILLMVGLLSGCAVGPDYKRPDLPVPGSYRYEAADATDTVNTEWWRQFEDPVLDALIDEALANNKNVKISAAKIEQAAGLLIQTRSPIFPQLNYSGLAERQRFTEYGATPLSTAVPNPQTAYQVLGSASWEIDLWGRIRRLTESSQASLLATEYAKRGVVLSLVASVASSYLQTAGAG